MPACRGDNRERLRRYSLYTGLLISVCLGISSFTCNPRYLFAQENEIELEPITVTLGQGRYYNRTRTSNTSIVKADEISSAHIEDILDYQEGVDISRRGIANIQSDLTIRGATFEQTKISINNVNVNDPQTSHHNLDLGIPQSMIDTLEITRGSLPLIWGQGAMGGAVNIITKRPVDDRVEVGLLYGTDQTHKESIYVSKVSDRAGVNLALEEAASNGWRHDTDFKKTAFCSSASLDIAEQVSGHLLIGYDEKEFGAANFYGRYNSKEWTNTLFSNISLEMGQDDYKLIPMLYFRRHHDKFMLKIEDPDLYLNHHTTDVEGMILQAEIDRHAWGVFSLGTDTRREAIDSTNLGNGSRSSNAIFIGWSNPRLRYFGYELSIRLDDYSEYNSQLLPYAGAYMDLTSDVRLRSSVSKSARVPSYTELFYNSPTDKGSSSLSTEESINYEAGLDMRTVCMGRSLVLSLTAFRRDGSDLIDWVKENPSQVFYQAKNITDVNTEGIETALDIDTISWLMLSVTYTYIDSDIKKEGEYISKYVLNHPGHKVTAGADIILPFGRQTISLLYKDRDNYSDYLIMNAILRYDLKAGTGLFVDIYNIFNSSHEDIKDNALPGREISAGMKVSF